MKIVKHFNIWVSSYFFCAKTDEPKTGTESAVGSHDVLDRRIEHELEPDEGFTRYGIRCQKRNRNFCWNGCGCARRKKLCKGWISGDVRAVGAGGTRAAAPEIVGAAGAFAVEVVLPAAIIAGITTSIVYGAVKLIQAVPDPDPKLARIGRRGRLLCLVMQQGLRRNYGIY